MKNSTTTQVQLQEYVQNLLYVTRIFKGDGYANSIGNVPSTLKGRLIL